MAGSEDQRSGLGGRREQDMIADVAVLSARIADMSVAMIKGFGDVTKAIEKQQDDIDVLNDFKVAQEVEQRMEEKLKAALAARDAEDTRRAERRSSVKLTKTQLLLGTIGGIGTIIGSVVLLGGHVG